jgi:hypothetical protein
LKEGWLENHTTRKTIPVGVDMLQVSPNGARAALKNNKQPEIKSKREQCEI